MIKFPKKISKKKLIDFFYSRGLANLVATHNLFKRKNSKLDLRRVKFSQPPELIDLYRLHQFIVINKRTTVLEFGCGYSTLIMALALKENELNFSKKPFLRCSYPYQLFSVDNQKKYINIAKKRIESYAKKLKVNFTFSEANMTIYNGNYAVEYKNLPRVNPDFIYIDAPSQWGVKNKINNFTTAHDDMMPMSCDVLKFENFLTPGTIIVTDGRTANARFIKNNFKRKWIMVHDEIYDQTIFYLNEKPLGVHNLNQLQFYKKK
jgi:16S rRNA G966 N2-methylase RsmD